MHIPDGLLSPQTYLPALVVATPLWVWSARRMKARLGEEALPRLAVFTAFAFLLSTLLVPLPGGTSGHAIGVGLLALAFGPWAAFLAYTLVLALQALVVGAGGITALPVNALAVGFVGAHVSVGVHRLLRRRRVRERISAGFRASRRPPGKERGVQHSLCYVSDARRSQAGWIGVRKLVVIFSRALSEPAAVLLAVWLSVMVSALLVGLALGVQPSIAQSADGTPRFFPFGLAITLPALLLPHAFIGTGEAVLTWFVLRHARRRRWVESAP